MQPKDFKNPLVRQHFVKALEGTNNCLFYLATIAPINDKKLVFPDSIKKGLNFPPHINTFFDYRNQHNGIYERLYQFCVISLCSDIELFFKSLFEKYGFSAENGQGFYQRFGQVIKSLEASGLDFSEIRDSIKSIELAFQIRHIGIHNWGVVDESFVNKTGLGSVGESYPVDQSVYLPIFKAYEGFLKHLDTVLPTTP